MSWQQEHYLTFPCTSHLTALAKILPHSQRLLKILIYNQGKEIGDLEVSVKPLEGSLFFFLLKCKIKKKKKNHEKDQMRERLATYHLTSSFYKWKKAFSPDLTSCCHTNRHPQWQKSKHTGWQRSPYSISVSHQKPTSFSRTGVFPVIVSSRLKWTLSIQNGIMRDSMLLNNRTC